MTQERKRYLTALGFTVLFFLGFLGFFIRGKVLERKFDKNGRLITGVVTKVVSGGRYRVDYQIDGRSEWGEFDEQRGLHVGDRVPLYYLPDDHYVGHRNEIQGWSPMILKMILFGIGLLLLLLILFPNLLDNLEPSGDL